MECGKDQTSFYQVIDSLQGRNRAALLPTSGIPIDATEELSEFLFTKIRERLDESEKTFDKPLHITTILPLIKETHAHSPQSFGPMTVQEISKIIRKFPQIMFSQPNANLVTQI